MEILTMPAEQIHLHNLIEGCQRQDRDAQKKLYETYKSQMFKVCLRYASNTPEAEDLLQEGFIKVFRSLNTWQPSGSFVSWMKTIMIHTALEHKRKLSQKAIHQDVTTVYDLQNPEDVISKISGEELLELIQKLPDGFRTIFNLYAIEGYSHAEISSLLGISEGTSKSQYSRAKAILRSQCERLMQEGRIS
jgi:RNA polymerase sigma factor (sigma-70 family)